MEFRGGTLVIERFEQGVNPGFGATPVMPRGIDAGVSDQDIADVLAVEAKR